MPYCLAAARPLQAGNCVLSYMGKASMRQPQRRTKSRILESQFPHTSMPERDPFCLTTGQLGGENETTVVRWKNNVLAVSLSTSTLLPTQLYRKAAHTGLHNGPGDAPPAVQGVGEHSQRQTAEIRQKGETEAQRHL